jgi:hypothetical protein
MSELSVSTVANLGGRLMASVALPRFLETHASRVDHARKLERVVRESGGNMRELKLAHTAADGRTLRGIPAIGRGVAGCIAGTNPATVV